jgi:large subunit ribosomal protein L15
VTQRALCYSRRFALEYRELNLDKLDTWLRAGRLDASQLITMKHLRDSGCINKNIKTGVVLLGGVRTIHIRLNTPCQKSIKGVKRRFE